MSPKKKSRRGHPRARRRRPPTAGAGAVPAGPVPTPVAPVVTLLGDYLGEPYPTGDLDGRRAALDAVVLIRYADRFLDHLPAGAADIAPDDIAGPGPGPDAASPVDDTPAATDATPPPADGTAHPTSGPAPTPGAPRPTGNASRPSGDPPATDATTTDLAAFLLATSLEDHEELLTLQACLFWFIARFDDLIALDGRRFTAGPAVTDWTSADPVTALSVREDVVTRLVLGHLESWVAPANEEWLDVQDAVHLMRHLALAIRPDLAPEVPAEAVLAGFDGARPDPPDAAVVRVMNALETHRVVEVVEVDDGVRYAVPTGLRPAVARAVLDFAEGLVEALRGGH